MAKGILGQVSDAGHAVVDAAKSVGHTIAEKASDAVEFVKEKTGLAPHELVDVSGVKERMNVLASDGTKIGSVASLEGGAIKLSLRDSPDGLYHFIPVAWVKKVEAEIHLRQSADEAKREWKPTASAC